METAPLGLYTQAFVNAVNYIRNYSIDDMKANLEKTKNTTVMEVESAIRNINAGECYAVLANESTLRTADVSFDEVIDLTKEEK